MSPLISLVKCLNAPEQFEDAAGSQDDIRVEAAQVITSLSYGAGLLLRTSPAYTHPRVVRFPGSPPWTTPRQRPPGLPLCYFAIRSL